MLSLAKLQAIIGLMSATGDISAAQVSAWQTLMLMVPWYSGEIKKPIDAVWRMPAESVFAGIKSGMGVLVDRALFDDATASLAAIAKVMNG